MIDEKALEAAARAICLHCLGKITDGDVEGYRGEARAAITAYLGALEGFVLVPEAGLERIADGTGGIKLARAMLAAARPQNEGE